MKKFFAASLACLIFSGCATQQASPIASRNLFSALRKDDFSALKTEHETKKLNFSLLSAKVASTEAEKVAQQKAAQEVKDTHQKLTDAQTASLDEKFTRVMGECNVVITGMATKVENQEKNSFWLAMSGLVAGAVLAPAATAANATAHRAFISATSGWAGATNLASQTQRTVGLAGDSVATTRNGIVTNLNKAIADATNAEFDYDRRFSAIQAAQSACISYAITVPGAVPSMPTSDPKPAAGGDGSGK